MNKISSLARMGIAHRCFGNPIPQAAYDLIDATQKCVEEFNPPTLADFKGHPSLADMVSTHIHSWRDALKIAQSNSSPADPVEGTDDRAYWEHELKALEDIENAVKQLIKENN